MQATLLHKTLNGTINEAILKQALLQIILFGTLLASATVMIEEKTRMVEHDFLMKIIQIFGMGGKCVEELCYGSFFLLELAKKDTQETLAKMINLYSKTDLVIIPYSSSILKGARNIDIESDYGIKGIGHQRLVFNEELYRKIGELFESRVEFR